MQLLVSMGRLAQTNSKHESLAWTTANQHLPQETTDADKDRTRNDQQAFVFQLCKNAQTGSELIKAHHKVQHNIVNICAEF